MAGRRGHGGSRRRRAHAEAENEERWLLTYADMITLLMALFMVLFSITSVNKSKLDVLTRSLQEAFSGKIMSGGKSIRSAGANPDSHSAPTAEPPIPAIAPLLEKQQERTRQANGGQDGKEQDDFRRLKQQIDAYARAHGLARTVQTTIAQRGLVIRLLTDRVLFDSGQADLKPQAKPLLTRIAGLLQAERRHRIQVEGHTDSVPIRGSVFPTNWELSTSRAARVVRFLIDGGVPAGRLGAAGYAALHPIATNGTAAGRSRNRRVE